MSDSLAVRRCKPCEGGVAPLSDTEAQTLLRQLKGWALKDGVLTKTFEFKDFHQTMAFVNAVAWLSHREDHHPDLQVGYYRCGVNYITHAINGLSENDFICAAKVDGLFSL